MREKDTREVNSVPSFGLVAMEGSDHRKIGVDGRILTTRRFKPPATISACVLPSPHAFSRSLDRLFRLSLLSCILSQALNFSPPLPLEG